MGLDIVAFERVVLVDDHPYDDEKCDDAQHVQAFVIEGFEHALGSLIPGRCYTCEGETYGFGAGSYSGYGHWRDMLADIAIGVKIEDIWSNPEQHATDPFFHILCFADNEGTIGPEPCAKLALDFHHLRTRVRPRMEEFDRGRYDDFARAFELAAGKGMVLFT